MHPPSLRVLMLQRLLPALEARGIGAPDPCPAHPGLALARVMPSSVPSTAPVLRTAMAAEGRKTATAMRGGSTTPLPSFQMHIKGLSSEYLYLPPPLQICPGSCPSVFLSAFAVNARSP